MYSGSVRSTDVTATSSDIQRYPEINKSTTKLDVFITHHGMHSAALSLILKTSDFMAAILTHVCRSTSNVVITFLYFADSENIHIAVGISQLSTCRASTVDCTSINLADHEKIRVAVGILQLSASGAEL
jgi:hypothetical protein